MDAAPVVTEQKLFDDKHICYRIGCSSSYFFFLSWPFLVPPPLPTLSLPPICLCLLCARLLRLQQSQFLSTLILFHPSFFSAAFAKKKIEPNSDGDHLIRKNERMLAPGKNAQRGGCRRLVWCIAVLGRKEGFGSLSERGCESTMRTPYPAH